MSWAWCQNLFWCVVRLHVVFLLCEDDVEDSVGAAAGFVHVGSSHSPGKKKENVINNDDVGSLLNVPIKWLLNH